MHDCGGDALYFFAACPSTGVTFTPASCGSSPPALIAGRPCFQASGSAETSWKPVGRTWSSKFAAFRRGRRSISARSRRPQKRGLRCLTWKTLPFSQWIAAHEVGEVAPTRRGASQRASDGEDAAATAPANLRQVLPSRFYRDRFRAALWSAVPLAPPSRGGGASPATTGAGLPKDKAEAELPHSKGGS